MTFGLDTEPQQSGKTKQMPAGLMAHPQAAAQPDTVASAFAKAVAVVEATAVATAVLDADAFPPAIIKHALIALHCGITQQTRKPSVTRDLIRALAGTPNEQHQGHTE